jgi:predicted DNA-binding transcriptional regulator AlpA
MRLPEVEHLVGLHGSTIYRLVRKGKFPKPIPLTDRASSRLLENRPAA